MHRLVVLASVAFAFVSTADSLVCYTCDRGTCVGGIDQWVQETCSPDSTICYTFYNDWNEKRVWRKGCGFKDCAHVPGYTQGAPCEFCASDKCNNQPDDRPVAGCIGQPNCPSDRNTVKPWNPTPFLPEQGSGEGGGLSWGQNGSSRINMCYFLILFMSLCTYLRFAL
uniref:Uncharacterized protein n=1 Tax=Plectus sambesii TaxID=2011161 RepID=A0A914VMY5_9BILA